MSTEEQIAALDQLIEERRHTCPIEIREVRAIGHEAFREFVRRLIQRANEMYGAKT